MDMQSKEYSFLVLLNFVFLPGTYHPFSYHILRRYPVQNGLKWESISYHWWETDPLILFEHRRTFLMSSFFLVSITVFSMCLWMSWKQAHFGTENREVQLKSILYPREELLGVMDLKVIVASWVFASCTVSQYPQVIFSATSIIVFFKIKYFS